MTNWAEYEELVRRIVEGIDPSPRDIRKLGHGRQNKVLGASGQRHQVDVSFEDHTDTPPAVVLVECKLKAEVKLSDVKVLHATMLDVAAALEDRYSVRGFLVSIGRLQSGAQRYADRYGIHVESNVNEEAYVFGYEGIVQAKDSESTGSADEVFEDVISPPVR